MNCQRARDVLSADLDGEPPQGSLVSAQAHLNDCSGCGSWLEVAHLATRAVRIGSPLPSEVLPGEILGAVARDVHQRRVRRYWLTVFVAVACAGALQLLATVPLLMMVRANPAAQGGHVLALAEALVGAVFFLGAVIVLWKTRELSLLGVVRLEPKAESEAAAFDRQEVA